MSQPIVKNANPSIVEPLLNLLKTLHLEVQFEGRILVFAYQESGSISEGPKEWSCLAKTVSNTGGIFDRTFFEKIYHFEKIHS